MKKLIKLIALIASAFLVNPAFSGGPTWMEGNMMNFSSIRAGIVFQLDRTGPPNCAGTSHYLIRKDHKAMIAVALTKWAQNSPWVTVYTSGPAQDEPSFCELTQLQPW